MLAALNPPQPEWDMADFNPCPYSKKAVVGAGKLLAGTIPERHARSEKTLDAFRIARSWRESNIYPMRRVRAELLGKIRAAKAEGITAARVKRMSSIRRKLKPGNLGLYQMQDIAGCRAILSNASNFATALRPYLDGASRYAIVDDDDYVARPKVTGYRGRHLVLKFSDPENRGFDRHFVEVQFRTLKQHSWATAVEAVGLVRREELKANQGDADWLRLFKLMAGEMAEDEGGAPVPSVSEERDDRRKELTDLNRRLRALQTLDSYNRAIKRTEGMNIVYADYYLIEYNIARMEVSVRPFYGARSGSEQYACIESDANVNSVLVNVEKVADLREAYPNYFLDVGAFAERLRQALAPPESPITLPRVESWYEDWKSWKQKER